MKLHMWISYWPRHPAELTRLAVLSYDLVPPGQLQCGPCIYLAKKKRICSICKGYQNATYIIFSISYFLYKLWNLVSTNLMFQETLIQIEIFMCSNGPDVVIIRRVVPSIFLFLMELVSLNHAIRTKQSQETRKMWHIIVLHNSYLWNLI